MSGKHLNQFIHTVLAALLTLCCALPLSAEADGLEIGPEGTRIARDCYGSAVTLRISGADGGRILVKENGRWMSLAAGSDGVCRVTFTEDREYRLRFCRESANGERSGFTDVAFTIDRTLAAFLEQSREMPDIYTATDRDVADHAEQLLALANQMNMLTARERALVPEQTRHSLETYLPWLGRVRPRLDVTPPAVPQARVEGESIRDGTVCRTGARILLTPAGDVDFDRLLMRIDGKWAPLMEVEGAYAVDCPSSGVYAYDFCAQDRAGNRSESVRLEFIVSDALYDFYQSADLGTGVGAQEALLRCSRFNAYTRGLVEDGQVAVLTGSYDAACRRAGLTPTVRMDGGEARILGLLTGFEGTDGARLEAVGAPATGRIASDRPILYEYRFSFTREGKTVSPGGELCYLIEMPDELLRRRNITVYDSGGKPLQTRVHTRDDGYLLSFLAPGGGTFYVAADA